MKLTARSQAIYDKIAESIKTNNLTLDSGAWGVTIDATGKTLHVEDAEAGAVCAVGAGCLWNSAMQHAPGIHPVIAFASLHDVSPLFAFGVSDGFESNTEENVEDISWRTLWKRFVHHLNDYYEGPASLKQRRIDSITKLEAHEVGTKKDYCEGVRLGCAIASKYLSGAV